MRVLAPLVPLLPFHRLGALTGPGFDDGSPFGKSHLPSDAQVLIVGSGGVGKTSLGRALQRLAKKVRSHARMPACPRAPPLLEGR